MKFKNHYTIGEILYFIGISVFLLLLIFGLISEFIKTF